jgi:hypothetical protein
MGERQYKISSSVHELMGNHDTDSTKIAHPPNGPTCSNWLYQLFWFTAICVHAQTANIFSGLLTFEKTLFQFQMARWPLET